MGLLLCERYAGRGLATIYQRELTRAIRANFQGLTVHWEGLTNGQAWQSFLADAKLSKIRVIRHSVSTDIADDLTQKYVYDLMYSAKPRRGQRFFPNSIKEGLLSGNIKPGVILGLQPEMQLDETHLELQTDTWQKDFTLDQQMPVLVYAASDDDSRRPDDGEIYSRMAEVALELCQTLGVDLPTGWQKGAWSADALAVALEAVRAS